MRSRDMNSPSEAMHPFPSSNSLNYDKRFLHSIAVYSVYISVNSTFPLK